MRGVKVLISAASFTALPTSGVPEDIVYIPEGEHKITPTVNGKPQAITVKVPPEKGATIAAALQADLTKRLADNVRPIIDFDHAHRGPAAGIPREFRYEPGRGIVLALDWTNAGRTAVEGKDFSYFSPEFLINEDGTPGGLPSRGPLGSMVNNPAFREIPRVAASDAAPNHQSDPINPIMKLILASLAISEAAANAEEAAVTKISAMQKEIEKVPALEKELDELKTKLEAAEADAEKTRKERAETLVKAAVADGRILAKDEDKQTKFRDKIAAGDTFAEEILAGLPKQHGDITKPIVRAGQGEKAGADTKDDELTPYERVQAAFAAEEEGKSE